MKAIRMFGKANRAWLAIAVVGVLLGPVAGSVAEARSGSSGMIFDVNLFYNSSKQETTNTGSSASTDSDSTVAIYDIKLGYLSGSGLYFGGMYTSRSNSVLNQSGTSGSAMGASIGYMSDAGLFVQGHYLLDAKLGVYSEGSGIQADFGYKASVSSNWVLGAELSYRSVDYKKSSSNASLASFKYTEVIPMVSFGFMF